jgi:hypothetical protein
VQKSFPFNEFGPSLLQGTSAFPRDSACLYGRAISRRRCFPDRVTTGGSVGLPPAPKRRRLAVTAFNSRHVAAADPPDRKRQRRASACRFVTAMRLHWNPLNQHGSSAATLLGEEPHLSGICNRIAKSKGCRRGSDSGQDPNRHPISSDLQQTDDRTSLPILALAARGRSSCFHAAT